jgi:hypothetical protein
VLYTLWRILLFVAVLGVGYLAGMRGWLLVVVAAVVALAVSYLALRGPRDAAAGWLAERAERRKSTGERFSRQIQDDAAYEDAAVDRADDAR